MVVNSSFDAVAYRIISDYVRSVVIIDDEWPEASVGGGSSDSLLDESSLVVDNDEIAIEDEDSSDWDIVKSSRVDADLLWRLQQDLLARGLLACGLRYRAGFRDRAVALAKRADIVVLDWHLIGDEGHEATEILRNLMGGGLRFVCVFTGRGRIQEVEDLIVSQLGASKSVSGHGSFRVRNLVIAIRNKEGLEEADPGYAVAPENLLDAAVEGIAGSYGGLIQLAMLEMTHIHREQLPKILERIGTAIDLPVMLEVGNTSSPVEVGGAFLGVLVDEWRAHLEQSQSKLVVLGRQGRKGFGARLAGLFSNIPVAVLKSFMERAGLKPTLSKTIAESPGLGGWLRNGCYGPVVEDANYLKHERSAAWGLLASLGSEGHDSNERSVAEPLLKLDVLFHQQLDLPPALTQGSVVCLDKRGKASYFICVTPSCDAVRPEKIANLFFFVRAQVVDSSEVLTKKGEVGPYCVIEDRGQPICLQVRIRERISLEILNAKFRNGYLRAAGPVKEANRRRPISLRRVAQLRLEHAISLSAASSSDAARVGVNRVEFIRANISRGD